MTNLHTHNLTEEAAAIIHNFTPQSHSHHTAHARCPLRLRHLPTIEEGGVARLRAAASIHSSICARPFFEHRLHWPCDEIAAATNLEASERIDRARDGDDALARWPHRPPGCDQPNTKKATLSRSLARSFAPSGIRSYDSFESASLSYFPCTTRRRRMRDRPNNASSHACPCPRPALPYHP